MVFRFIAVAPCWLMRWVRPRKAARGLRHGVRSRRDFQPTRPAVARLCRLRRPPEPERLAKPSVCARRHTRGGYRFNRLRALVVTQTGAGWSDGSLAHPDQIDRSPAAGDAWDGAAAPALAASAAGHPARLRAGHERESHGRKPAHQVSPLATFSQRHAKLMRTHSSGRRPCHNTQYPWPRQLLRQFTPFQPHSGIPSKNKWSRLTATNSPKIKFNAGPTHRRSVTYSVNFLPISPWTRHP